jgi:hypothetical protein
MGTASREFYGSTKSVSMVTGILAALPCFTVELYSPTKK